VCESVSAVAGCSLLRQPGRQTWGTSRCHCCCLARKDWSRSLASLQTRTLHTRRCAARALNTLYDLACFARWRERSELPLLEAQQPLQHVPAPTRPTHPPTLPCSHPSPSPKTCNFCCPRCMRCADASSECRHAHTHTLSHTRIGLGATRVPVLMCCSAMPVRRSVRPTHCEMPSHATLWPTHSSRPNRYRCGHH
jgi:hypothetical protein